MEMIGKAIAVLVVLALAIFFIVPFIILLAILIAIVLIFGVPYHIKTTENGKTVTRHYRRFTRIG